MTVSVIIPIYNVAPYIERCLKSVVNQTYTDIECILVDDCGTDNSIEIAEKLINDYTGPIIFKVLHHDHNRGLSAARNTGTNAATGDYVFYLDSDDEITPDAIFSLLNAVQQYPELEMVIGDVTSVPHDDYYDLKIPRNPFIIKNDNNAVRLLFLNPQLLIPVMAWNKLIKLGFIKQNSLFFKEGIIHEDEHWIYFVVKQLKNVAFIKSKTYYHYETPQSIMSTSSSTQRADCIMLILVDILNNIDTPYSDLQLIKYLNYYFNYYIDANATPQKRKVRFLLIKQLLIHHYYYMTFHFILHQYRNRSVQLLKYKLIPQKTKKISVKYKM